MHLIHDQMHLAALLVQRALTKTEMGKNRERKTNRSTDNLEALMARQNNRKHDRTNEQH